MIKQYLMIWLFSMVVIHHTGTLAMARPVRRSVLSIRIQIMDCTTYVRQLVMNMHKTVHASGLKLYPTLLSMILWKLLIYM